MISSSNTIVYRRDHVQYLTDLKVQFDMDLHYLLFYYYILYTPSDSGMGMFQF